MMDDLSAELAASSISDYEYSPLPQKDDRRWIRVLDLLPSEDRTAPLRLCLRTALLERGLSYEAVSYVWGSADSTAEILIAHNGTSFKS
jgi:hypothetical protein